jgi:hypothetical protein
MDPLVSPFFFFFCIGWSGYLCLTRVRTFAMANRRRTERGTAAV